MEYTVAGARGETPSVDAFVEALRAQAEQVGLEVQAFDADMVFGENHILSALQHAERAFRRGTNLAADRMMEVLVYAAGERQISNALEKMGVKEGKDRIVILAVGEGDVNRLLEGLGLERDDSLVEGRRDMLQAFGITDKEAETVPPDRLFELVLERVALVDLLK